MHKAIRSISAVLCALVVQAGSSAQEPSPREHDVVWDSPSPDASGSMPLGNGDIGLNAWMEPGGELVFYIAKTDSWGDNGRLLKVGRLRIRTDPPLATSEGFEQRLALAEGALLVRCGEGPGATLIRLWVDAHHPAVHVTIEGPRERTAAAEIDLWRGERTPYPECEVSDLLEDRTQPGKRHAPIFVEPDTILAGLGDRIGWYHFNRTSVGPALTARLQGLSEYFEGRVDPLLHRIFGAVVTAPGARRVDDRRLASAASKRHRFSVFVSTEHPSTPQRWLASLETLAKEAERLPFEERRAAHESWWREFWQRSWIHVTQKSGSDPVPRNEHPVRIGIDPHGSNPFVGEFGRLTIAARTATPTEIAQLASERSGAAVSLQPSALFQNARAEPGPIADSASWSFATGLTIETWLKPGPLPAGGGRIIDKITPGASDGLLLDTHPGRSLRLIVGSRIVSASRVLPGDRWVHVAATLDSGSGALALFVDGRRVVGDSGSGLDDAVTVSRAYALQRWIDACAGRGRYPIKFNGSIFTVPHPGKFGDGDYRRWGPGYWWQNTRLPYLSMCASGDVEMMRPLFRMYAEELMPLHVFRTRRYTGHGGAFIPECMYFWGPTFTATYGWKPFDERGEDKLQESPWHKWEWVSGLELVWMMLDYVDHTEDEAFAREILIPTAREILSFFEEHFPIGTDGKLHMTPSQALETWWDCTNPMPEVAGLQAVTARLLARPADSAPGSDRALWQRVLAKTPELPTWEKDGVRLLAPAGRFAAKSNIENPELYAVFPFRLVSFEKDSAELGVRALANRWDRGASGWRQDDLFMTHLGLAEEARVNLVRRARNKHAGSRFPAFWGPNYDWIPDQDHGGVLMRALQTMLMQTEGRAIHLLPAWPREWEVDFKLHAPYRTTVSGKVRAGRVVDLAVVPESRRKDVVLHERPPESGRGVPTPEQLAWHAMEIEMFVCLDPCTWQGREYDDHSTPLDRIHPSRLDTDQWCEVARSIGAGQILFVAKHTGGFCWWQTATTEYSIKNTPYKDGKGDLLAELSESCRKYGLKLAVYIYPGDDQWGAGIGSGGRTADPSKQAAYDAVLRQQWTEVLTRYGEISELWFDGSCVIELGDIIERHAPRAMVFQGPHATLRWVGNERGIAPDPLWQTVRRDDAASGVATSRHSDPDGEVWLPVEVDTTLLDHKWFWAPGTDAMMKSLEQLVQIYYQSVGRGAVLLLNSTPDTTGLIPPAHVKRYREFGAAIRRIHANCKGETSGQGEVIELVLDRPSEIDHIITMEDIRSGQSVRRYELEGRSGDQWHSLRSGRSIGYKRIDVLESTRVDALRLRVTDAVGTPRIQSFAAYHVGDSAGVGATAGDGDAPWQVVSGWPDRAIAATWQTSEVNLTPYIRAPGQYELRLRRTGGEVELAVQDVVVVVGGGSEAPRLIAPLPRRHAWMINRSAQVSDGEKGRTLIRFAARMPGPGDWEGVLEIRSR